MKNESGIVWSEPLDYLTEEILNGGRYAIVYHGDQMGPEDFFRRFANCFTNNPDKFRNRASYYQRAMYCVLAEKDVEDVCLSYGDYAYKLRVDPRKFLHCDYDTFKSTFPQSTATPETFHLEQIHSAKLFKDPEKEKLAAQWLMRQRWESYGRGASVAAMIGSTYPEIYHKYAGISYNGGSDSLCMIIFDYAEARPVMWTDRDHWYSEKSPSKWVPFDKNIVKDNIRGMLNRIGGHYNENLPPRDMVFIPSEIDKYANWSKRGDEALLSGDVDTAIGISYKMADAMKRKLSAIEQRIDTSDSTHLHTLMSSIVSSNSSIVSTSKNSHNYDMIVDLSPVMKNVTGCLALKEFFEFVQKMFENRSNNRFKEFDTEHGYVRTDGYYNLVNSRDWNDFLTDLKMKIHYMICNAVLLSLSKISSAKTPDEKSAFLRFLGSIDTRPYFQHWSDALKDSKETTMLANAIHTKTLIGYNKEDNEALGNKTDLVHLSYREYKNIVNYLYLNGENGPVELGSFVMDDMYSSLMTSSYSASQKADEIYELAQKIVISDEDNLINSIKSIAINELKNGGKLSVTFQRFTSYQQYRSQFPIALLHLYEREPVLAKRIFAGWVSYCVDPVDKILARNLFEYVR